MKRRAHDTEHSVQNAMSNIFGDLESFTVSALEIFVCPGVVDEFPGSFVGNLCKNVHGTEISAL
jgi:hypothetical protein